MNLYQIHKKYDDYRDKKRRNQLIIYIVLILSSFFIICYILYTNNAREGVEPIDTCLNKNEQGEEPLYFDDKTLTRDISFSTLPNGYNPILVLIKNSYNCTVNITPQNPTCLNISPLTLSIEPLLTDTIYIDKNPDSNPCKGHISFVASLNGDHLEENPLTNYLTIRIVD